MQQRSVKVNRYGNNNEAETKSVSNGSDLQKYNSLEQFRKSTQAENGRFTVLNAVQGGANQSSITVEPLDQAVSANLQKIRQLGIDENKKKMEELANKLKPPNRFK